MAAWGSMPLGARSGATFLYRARHFDAISIVILSSFDARFFFDVLKSWQICELTCALSFCERSAPPCALAQGGLGQYASRGEVTSGASLFLSGRNFLSDDPRWRCAIAFFLVTSRQQLFFRTFSEFSRFWANLGSMFSTRHHWFCFHKRHGFVLMLGSLRNKKKGGRKTPLHFGVVFEF